MVDPSSSKLTSASSNVYGGNAYIGIPVTQEDDSGSSKSKSNNAITAGLFYHCYGILALMLGVLLSAIFWVAFQACTISSVLLFGKPVWAFGSLWKHLLVHLIGCFSSMIVVYAVSKVWFPRVSRVLEGEEDDDDEDDTKETMYEKDVWRTLGDLTDFGFMVGFVFQVLFAQVVAKPFGIIYVLRPGFEVVFVVNILLWMLCIKIENVHRAMKRASRKLSVSKPVSFDYVQIV